MRLPLLIAVAAASAAMTQPAAAHGHGGHHGATTVRSYPGHWGGPFGMWYGGWQPQTVVNLPPPAAPDGAWQGGYDRDAWLKECRRRLGDNGVGGAVIGGVVGGVAGNVIAGSGNRAVGTIAGAAAGAIAGAVIDKAEDRGRVRDRCEAMLDAPPAPAAYAPYGAGYVMVPVMMMPVAPAPRHCTKTVVTEEVWEPAPRRARVVRHRAPDKRVRLVPDKRIAP